MSLSTPILTPCAEAGAAPMASAATANAKFANLIRSSRIVLLLDCACVIALLSARSSASCPRSYAVPGYRQAVLAALRRRPRGDGCSKAVFEASGARVIGSGGRRGRIGNDRGQARRRGWPRRGGGQGLCRGGSGKISWGGP